MLLSLPVPMPEHDIHRQPTSLAVCLLISKFWKLSLTRRCAPSIWPRFFLAGSTETGQADRKTRHSGHLDITNAQIVDAGCLVKKHVRDVSKGTTNTVVDERATARACAAFLRSVLCTVSGGLVFSAAPSRALQRLPFIYCYRGRAD